MYTTGTFFEKKKNCVREGGKEKERNGNDLISNPQFSGKETGRKRNGGAEGTRHFY